MSSDRKGLVAVPEAARAVASVPGPHCSAVQGDQGQHKDSKDIPASCTASPAVAGS